MDKITKQVNIENLKSHTPGVLPYIPYGGDDFVSNPEEGNWGGFPINLPKDFEGAIVVVDWDLKTSGDTPSFIFDNDYEDNDLGCAAYKREYVQLYVFKCGEWNKFFGHKGNAYQIPNNNDFVVWNNDLKRWEFDDKKKKENKRTYEPYLSIISRFHKFQQIIDSGIKVKQIREGSDKYTPRFEGDFVVDGCNIVNIEHFLIDDNLLYNVRKDFSYNEPHYLLVSQENYVDYCKLGGFAEYERISSFLGILIVDNTIEGELVPNFLYISSIKTYIDELEKYKEGDCCLKRRYEAMGGDAMLNFLKKHKPSEIVYPYEKEYFYLPISEEIYNLQTGVTKTFTGKTSSNRETGELSAWAQMDKYVSNKTGEIKETSNEYLHAIVQTYDDSGKIVFEYNYFFKKNWRSPLMPVINVSLTLTQNSDDLGVLSVYETENTVQTKYIPKDRDKLDGAETPYFYYDGEWELAKTKRVSYDGGKTWSEEENCWYGWENTGETETYQTESRLEQLRTREKKFNESGELLPYIKNEKGENIPPFKELETFNDVYLYSFYKDGKEKRVYSCDYIPKGGIKINGDEITFEYIIGAEYILDGEPETQCDIKVYGRTDSGEEILVHKVEIGDAGKEFKLRVDSTCPWNVTVIEEGEVFLELYDTNGKLINPGGTINIDKFIGSTLLKVETNTNWNISAEKCSVSPRSGSGEAEITLKMLNMFVGGETLVIAYGDKSQYKSTYYLNLRSDKYIKVRDKASKELKTIEVTSKSDDGDIEIELIVDSNTSWTVGTSGGWSDAYLKDGSHTYENYSGEQSNVPIILHVNENTATIERIGSLVITSGAFTLQIPIVQAAADYISVYENSKDEPTRYLTLNSVDELKRLVETNVTAGWVLDDAYENEEPYLYISEPHFEFDNAQHTENLVILTNAERLEIETEFHDISDSWCNLKPDGVLTVTPNHNNENRYCTIHVYGKTTNKEDVEYKIQIIQKA